MTRWQTCLRLWCVAALACLALGACRNKPAGVAADTGFQKRTQEALILAKPGSVVELPEGRFHLRSTLSLTVDHVTVRGKGMDKTILSFEGQKAGASGMLVTANGFTLEDLAIEDTAGDAVKITGGDGVTVRRVRTAWTHGPKATNGSYGIYPVQCQNVLVEDSVVIGASDAGIYVGQSKNAIVRRNRVEWNVAGIEIENTQYADVYENTAAHNTGGILAFNLPDLPVKDGKYARIFNNQVVANDTDNFAPSGNIVAKVPKGTGIMVMATKHIEIFGNTLKDNGTSNVAIVSYFSTENPINDASYDPYPGAIFVHDNVMSGGGADPSGLKVNALALVVGKPLGDILYDGIVDKKNHPAEDSRICVQGNGRATFLNFDAAGGYRHFSRGLGRYDCALPALQPVTVRAAL
ncbi:MAG: parallel beta-helix domain-containing protein [Terriglobia bacterium]